MVAADAGRGFAAACPDLGGPGRIDDQRAAQGNVVGAAAGDDFLHVGGVLDAADGKNRHRHGALDGPGPFEIVVCRRWVVTSAPLFRGVDAEFEKTKI